MTPLNNGDGCNRGTYYPNMFNASATGATGVTGPSGPTGDQGVGLQGVVPFNAAAAPFYPVALCSADPCSAAPYFVVPCLVDLSSPDPFFADLPFAVVPFVAAPFAVAPSSFSRKGPSASDRSDISEDLQRWSTRPGDIAPEHSG